jgi:hypothetical protein
MFSHLHSVAEKILILMEKSLLLSVFASVGFERARVGSTPLCLTFQLRRICMLIESLEGRQLFSANPVAALGRGGTAGALAQSAPGAVAAVAITVTPTAVTSSAAPSTPSQASGAADAAQAGTIANTAESSPGAVAAIAKPV